MEVAEAQVPQVHVPRVEVPIACVPQALVPKDPIPRPKVPISHVPQVLVPKAHVPRLEVPISHVPQAQVPTGSCHGAGQPRTPPDTLEEGTGQRGAVTSRTTSSSCGESLGDMVRATNRPHWQNPGEPGISPTSWCPQGPTAEVLGNRTAAASRLDIPAGGGSRLRPAPISRTQTTQRSLGASPRHYSPATAAAARGGMGLAQSRKAIRIYRQIHMESAPDRSPVEEGLRVRAAGPPAEGDPLPGFCRRPPGGCAGGAASIPVPITLFIYIITLFLFYRNI